MELEPLPYAEFRVRVGQIDTYGIDWSNYLSNRWQAGALQATIGFAIRPTQPTGYQYVVSAAGQSAALEPIWAPSSAGAAPAAAAGPFADGSVTWARAALNTSSLSSTVLSAAWTVVAGVTASGQAVNGQQTTASLNFSGATVGNDLEVIVAATMADGRVRPGKLLFKVRD